MCVVMVVRNQTFSKSIGTLYLKYSTDILAQTGSDARLEWIGMEWNVLKRQGMHWKVLVCG